MIPPFLKDNEGVLLLNTSHSYYYQVHCQLDFSEVKKCFCGLDS